MTGEKTQQVTEKVENTTEIVKPDPTKTDNRLKMGMVELTESVEEIAAKFDKFEELKNKILKEDDYYQTKNGVQAVGKTGLYKLGVAFNLDTLIVEETKVTKPENPEYIAYKVTVQCTAPNGRITMDVGFCDNTVKDRDGESEHVIRAMAVTRAKERCYVTMIGESAKKGNGKPSQSTKPKFCSCSTCMTGTDGKCKTCGDYSKTWWESHNAK